MGRFRWIFFDLFDTLCTVDEPVYYEGKRAAAEACGLDFDAFMAAWKATSPEASTGALRSPYARAEASLAAMGCSDRRAAAEVARLDVETIQHCVRWYGGAQGALGALRERGFSLGLISNATATTAFAVGPLGLRGLLDVLVFSYEAGVVKPDPAIFRFALNRAGAAPESSLFVGDGANHELDAARDFGLATLCMDHPEKALSFRDPDGLSSPDHPRVGGFEELLSLEDLAEAAPVD